MTPATSTRQRVRQLRHEAREPGVYAVTAEVAGRSVLFTRTRSERHGGYTTPGFARWRFFTVAAECAHDRHVTKRRDHIAADVCRLHDIRTTGRIAQVLP